MCDFAIRTDTNPIPGWRTELKKQTQWRDGCHAPLIYLRFKLLGPVGHPCGRKRVAQETRPATLSFQITAGRRFEHLAARKNQRLTSKHIFEAIEAEGFPAWRMRARSKVYGKGAG